MNPATTSLPPSGVRASALAPPVTASLPVDPGLISNDVIPVPAKVLSIVPLGVRRAISKSESGSPREPATTMLWSDWMTSALGSSALKP